MSHYEERIEQDLDQIREEVRKVIRRVEDQVRDAVRSLLDYDPQLANEVILGDRRVNRLIRRIDRLCHAFNVRHAPSAGHLRYVSAVLRFDIALERVGDYAGTIGREVAQLSAAPPGRVARDIELISQQARRSLGQAVASFQDADPDLATHTYGLAEQTYATLENVFADLIAVGEKRKIPLRDIFALLRIINLLKRVAEQAENICEQTVFAYTGQTEDPKTFRVLFVDERNDGVSQMAEGYARKAYPESGQYASAGWNPAAELDPGLAEFLDQNGIDVRKSSPKKLRPIHEEARHHHVVVALDPRTREHIPKIPFRTVFLEWDLDIPVDTLPKDLTEEQLAPLFKAVAHRVRKLMQTLRGPHAR
jgi:phosphate transport system protein